MPVVCMIRFLPDLEGILWLHHCGHNRWLSNRTDADAVMGPISNIARKVNVAECDAFKS